MGGAGRMCYENAAAAATSEYATSDTTSGEPDVEVNAGARVSGVAVAAVPRRGSAPVQIRRRRVCSVSEDRPVMARRSLYAEVTDRELREALATVCGAAETLQAPRAAGKVGSQPTSSLTTAIGRIGPLMVGRSSARSSVKEVPARPVSSSSGPAADLAALEAAEPDERGGDGVAESGLRT